MGDRDIDRGIMKAYGNKGGISISYHSIYLF